MYNYALGLTSIRGRRHWLRPSSFPSAFARPERSIAMAELEEDNDPDNMLFLFVPRKLRASRTIRLHFDLRRGVQRESDESIWACFVCKSCIWVWLALLLLSVSSSVGWVLTLLGSLILVPLYLKFGRRPVMLGSLVFVCTPVHFASRLKINTEQFCAGLIGSSQCNTFGSLMACRVLHGFGSGVCEALPVQLVNDIFFLHERGKRLGYYTGRSVHLKKTGASLTR